MFESHYTKTGNDAVLSLLSNCHSETPLALPHSSNSCRKWSRIFSPIIPETPLALGPCSNSGTSDIPDLLSTPEAEEPMALDPPKPMIVGSIQAKKYLGPVTPRKAEKSFRMPVFNPITFELSEENVELTQSAKSPSYFNVQLQSPVADISKDQTELDLKNKSLDSTQSLQIDEEAENPSGIAHKSPISVSTKNSAAISENVTNSPEKLAKSTDTHEIVEHSTKLCDTPKVQENSVTTSEAPKPQENSAKFPTLPEIQPNSEKSSDPPKENLKESADEAEIEGNSTKSSNLPEIQDTSDKSSDPPQENSQECTSQVQIPENSTKSAVTSEIVENSTKPSDPAEYLANPTNPSDVPRKNFALENPSESVESLPDLLQVQNEEIIEDGEIIDTDENSQSQILEKNINNQIMNHKNNQPVKTPINTPAKQIIENNSRGSAKRKSS